MKKQYQHPQAVVEGFAPNEYVAACWNLACTINGSDPSPTYNGDGKENNTHSPDACGNASNQVISVINGKVSVREHSADQGWLDCNFTNINPDDIKDDTYVEWTTTAADGRIWHHKGVTGVEDTEHPNHS